MENLVFLIIMIPCAAAFTGIGVYAMKRKKPMWFWSGSEVKPYEIRDIEISEDEAIEQAHAKLREIIDGALPDARILKKSVQGEFVDGKYVLKCELTAICDIAKQVELDVID